MNNPTHDQIAQKAHHLWKDRGCPEGIDNEIWLEAERQLREDAPPAARSVPGSNVRRIQADAADESRAEHHLSAGMSEQQAIQAGVRKPDPRNSRKPADAGAKKPGGNGQPSWDRVRSN